jgi:hypothetical protein
VTAHDQSLNRVNAPSKLQASYHFPVKCERHTPEFPVEIGLWGGVSGRKSATRRNSRLNVPEFPVDIGIGLWGSKERNAPEFPVEIHRINQLTARSISQQRQMV